MGETVSNYIRDRMKEIIASEKDKDDFYAKVGGSKSKWLEGGREYLHLRDGPIKITDLTTLCQCYNLNPLDFLIPNEEQERELLEVIVQLELKKNKNRTTSKPRENIEAEYYTRATKNRIISEPKALQKVFHFISPDKDVIAGNLEDAYKEVASKFRDATDIIEVHELLMKGENEQRMPEGTSAKANSSMWAKGYQNEQKKVHEAIIDTLKKKEKLDYKRYLYVSPSKRLFSKTKDTLIHAFLAEVSEQTLEHICSIISPKKPLYSLIHDNPSKCEFFIVGGCASYRHHAIVDKSYMLIEDYRFIGDATVVESLSVFDARENVPEGKAMRENFTKRYELAATANSLTEIRIDNVDTLVKAIKVAKSDAIQNSLMRSRSFRTKVKQMALYDGVSSRSPLISNMKTTRDMFAFKYDDLQKKEALLRDYM